MARRQQAIPVALAGTQSGSHHDAREWPCSWIRYKAKGSGTQAALCYMLH